VVAALLPRLVGVGHIQIVKTDAEVGAILFHLIELGFAD